MAENDMGLSEPVETLTPVRTERKEIIEQELISVEYGECMRNNDKLWIGYSV